MVIDNSIPPHHIHAANNTPSSPASTSASTLTREHLQQHNQRHQHNHHRPAPVRPICTALPRYNINQQQDHYDDTPTTATVNNNNALATATRGNDLSEPLTAGTLFSPNGDGDLVFEYNKITSSKKYTGYLSHNPFDDPSCSVDNNEDEAHRPVDPSLLTQQQQPEPDQQLAEQQPWSNGRHSLTDRKLLSLYTRFFRLDNTPATHSSQIVHSTWMWTGALFLIRFTMFLYAFSVLLADILLTERPRYEFCYLTQLSYLGLTSYLGTVSWHTLSEWRRERGLRSIKASITGQGNEAGSSAAVSEAMVATRTTTIERQHWLLTDMNFFLYHTICTFHVIVPLLFWGYLSVQGEARTMAIEMSVNSLWRNYSFHGGDLILVLFEISINSMPFIPSHILIVFFICLLYLAEAHLVHYVDGFWIYPFLDTSVGPIWVAMYLGVGVVIAAAFGVMYFLHRGRNWWFAQRAAAKTFTSSSVVEVNGGEAVVVPEMVVVTSSIPTVRPGTHLQSSFSSATQLPSGTVFIPSTTFNPVNYGPSSSSSPSSSHTHNHPIVTHTNTSTALFPTTAPPTTILTSGATGFESTLQQPLAIPTQTLIQSRRRSYSNCSNDSTTSTLVGSDEGMMTKEREKEKEKDFEAAAGSISERTARRLSMNGATQLQADGNGLQKVDEEEDGYETEGDR